MGSDAPLLFYNKGLCYLGKGEHCKAIELSPKPGLEPENTVTLITLGEVLYAMSGDIDTAMAKWQEVLEANPDDVFATYNLGLAFLEKARQTKQLKCGEMILNPAYVPARQNLATLAVNAGISAKP